MDININDVNINLRERKVKILILERYAKMAMVGIKAKNNEALSI